MPKIRFRTGSRFSVYDVGRNMNNNLRSSDMFRFCILKALTL